ncbi:DHA2 family efflux MFS transporter permease subunit [Companilactobacillus zhachilii]|uniref:DHA2 family efflux MFS transporter permease subunit n=1 Tax=Companilactobacillus zhachilii TaxID=2304606 RepID=A0A386PSQ7_9LACO|nr:MFS transporter [Companilactobacillus zhachilii]AYE37447.1 DHA2 family efflux MFS transporter permease subunit [Companilactobacillus zhachilii]
MKQVKNKNLTMILLGIGIVIFMSTLDSSIVTVALPVLSRALHTNMSLVNWVVTLYLIVMSSTLMIFGKLGDKYGKIRFFKWGTAIFVISSMLCALSLNWLSLILARSLQAIGAAMTMATSNGIIVEGFPDNRRGQALGWMGSFVSLGGIIGPSLGGILLNFFPWHIIFWLNVPVGAIAIYLLVKYLPSKLDKTFVSDGFDLAGSILLLVGFTSMFIGILLSQQWGWADWRILSLTLVGLILLIILYRYESKQKEPILPVSLFKNKWFTMQLLACFMVFIVDFFFDVLAPFYLQNAREFSPLFSGFFLLIFPVVQLFIAPMSGSLADRHDPFKITLVGLAIISFGQIFYVFSGLHNPVWIFAIGAALAGLGNGLFHSPNNVLVMSNVAAKDYGSAGSVYSLARTVGMVVGSALSTTLLFGSMSILNGSRVKSYTPNNPQLFIDGMHLTFGLSCLISVALLLGIFLWHRKAKRMQN